MNINSQQVTKIARALTISDGLVPKNSIGSASAPTTTTSTTSTSSSSSAPASAPPQEDDDGLL
jgi:hypothetical protein